MKVQLEKEFVLRMYCFTYQGERSIAFSLGAPWEEFREYYLGTRLSFLKSFATEVNETMKVLGIEPPPLKRDDLCPYWPRVGLFRYLFGRWIAPRKSRWSFYSQAVVFMGCALDSLIHFSESEIRPDQEDLISLRMDLCMSRSMIEDRCQGLGELDDLRNVEHFWKADWMPALPIEAVLGSLSPLLDSSARKSA